MGFSIDGTEVLLSVLESMIPADTDVDDALQAGAEIVRAEMDRRAPVKTGHLKSAIKVGKVRNTARGRTITVGIHRRDIKLKDGHYYPAYVEYGHGGPRPADPHPFIRPAYDLTKDEAWGAIKQAVIDKMKL